MNSADQILAAYDALRADQEALYKDLHRHPELSHQEHHTAERVAGRLQEHGFTDGTVSTRSRPFMSAADGIRVTVYGRGGHGSMPQHAIDPVVLAAMIVVRLQTVVSREVAPGDTAVLTIGSLQAGTRSNVIPDHAVL